MWDISEKYLVFYNIFFLFYILKNKRFLKKKSGKPFLGSSSFGKSDSFLRFYAGLFNTGIHLGSQTPVVFHITKMKDSSLQVIVLMIMMQFK